MKKLKIFGIAISIALIAGCAGLGGRQRAVESPDDIGPDDAVVVGRGGLFYSGRVKFTITRRRKG